MAYGNCGWCVYRDKKNPDICRNCSHNSNIAKPRFELGKVNIFDLTDGLKKRPKEQESKDPEPVPRTFAARQRVKLDKCSYCGETSLFFNEVNKKHECLNMDCKSRNLFIDVIWPEKPLQAEKLQDETVPDHNKGLSNPLFLGVKMLLADICSWIHEYQEGQYVCSDFAREVFDAATKRGIRCGYVVISFVCSDVGHAVVAFDTDHGLKFFEPQNGNEENVKVGRKYSDQIPGTPEKDVVREIEITWNDGRTTRIIEPC